MGIASKLIKKFDNEDVIKFSDKDFFSEQKNWIHTGSPELEFNIGILGFPVGLTEIGGDSKSGKTTLALHGMKTFQKTHPNGACIIMSSENRDNKQYAQQLGINTDEVLIIKSRFVEDLFYKLQVVIDETIAIWNTDKLPGKPKIYVMWDSIGATLSRGEVNAFKDNVEIMRKNMEKGTNTEYKHAKMAAFSKEARFMVKSILGQIYNLDIVFVALNHLTSNFDTGQKQSGGGTWVEFLPCLRLKTVRKEWVKLTQDKDAPEVGQITIVKVEKNDFGSRQKTEIEILLGYGVVLSQNDIDYGVTKGIIQLEGATKHSFMNGNLKWATKRQYYQNYYDNNKFLPILHKKIMEARHKDVLETKIKK